MIDTVFNRLNSAMTACLILLVQAYRLFISSLLGSCCRFEPSCSQYAIESFRLHGGLKGAYFVMRRVIHCHPWHPGGKDPVPKQAKAVLLRN